MNAFYMWVVTVLAHYYAAGYHAGYTRAMADNQAILNDAIATMISKDCGEK